MSSSSAFTPHPASSLAEVLDKNALVQDTVEQSASELVVINAVLKQEIPDHVQVGEVAQALQKTDELETRVQEAAADLAKVNEALEQQVDERAGLEAELAATKAALARAQRGQA